MNIKERTYARRLLILANRLDCLPPERFDFNRWAGNDWDGKADLSCGTSACSFGWATTMRTFRRAGLRLFRRTNSLGKFYGSPYVGLVGDPDWINAPENAATKIFGLDKEEFALLFVPHRYACVENDEQDEKFGRHSLLPSASVKEAAEQIRYFVQWKYGKEALNVAKR
jgi:hypothetical protein